jgi:hypothetical protein
VRAVPQVFNGKSAHIVYSPQVNDQGRKQEKSARLAAASLRTVCGLPKDSAIVVPTEDGMGAGPNYIVVEGKTFQKEELTLDNHVYKNCTLEHCRIYYSGGPYELIDTHILESELILNQPAKNIYSAIQIFKMKSPGSVIVAD